jgi:hypothetical protein
MMRIVFVAKHTNGGNDEESAITYALETLGHEVVRLEERKGAKATGYKADLMLFLKYYNLDVLSRVNYPKAFWYFDLVTYPDPTLESRNTTRINWMREVLPLVDLGFCTDGSWVEKCDEQFAHSSDFTGTKLVWLPQGFDSRMVGVGEPWVPNERDKLHEILFTGIGRGGGRGRERFVDAMVNRYKQSFHHVTRGVHGTALKQLIRSSKVVVAPDSPVADRYWSNRVYLTLGYGGFLLHPFCSGLANHYEAGEELAFYGGMEDLYDKVAYYMARPEERHRVAENGMQRTLTQHTYLHRCRELVATVKGRLGT